MRGAAGGCRERQFNEYAQVASSNLPHLQRMHRSRGEKTVAELSTQSEIGTYLEFSNFI